MLFKDNPSSHILQTLTDSWRHDVAQYTRCELGKFYKHGYF